jgi:hypothetical protein
MTTASPLSDKNKSLFFNGLAILLGDLSLSGDGIWCFCHGNAGFALGGLSKLLKYKSFLVMARPLQKRGEVTLNGVVFLLHYIRTSS